MSTPARAATRQKRQFDAIEQLLASLHQIIGPPVEQPYGGEVTHPAHQHGHGNGRVLGVRFGRAASLSSGDEYFREPAVGDRPTPP